MTASTQRPLAGIKVVDFGQYIAGPAVAMMLADQGAEVIHIDPPGGARWDNPAVQILNRGKQVIELDLKQADDLHLVQQLIARADVLIENFRPGVMERLGLGYQAMKKANPALIYLSLPGFSEHDQALAASPAWEGCIAAAVGQFTDMGLNRVLMGVNPSFSPLPLASAYASVLGAMSVNLALFARYRTGQGERIEVPISAALMEGLAYNSMQVENLPDRYKSPRELEIERRRANGEPLNLDYAALQPFLDPFYRTYICQDGRPFYAVCSSHSRHPIGCLKVLGLWSEIEAAGIPIHSPYLDISDWPQGADCTLLSYPLSPQWAAFVSQRMQQAFATKPAYQWQQLFGEAGVPGCAHQTTAEWIASEHAQASGSILTVTTDAYGPMQQAGNICWLADDHTVVHKQAANRIDRNRLVECINNWDKGFASTHLNNVETDSGWLDGIRILDLTNVIAGPTVAGTLARFGAEVISIDPPQPTLDPWNTTVFGMQANQGKRSLLLDIKTADGQQLLRQLLADVDVVTINGSEEQLVRLGLSMNELNTINPQLILCQFDAYGGPQTGPRTNHPGYDDLVQATTGIMARFGGGMDTPEEHAHFGTIDVLGGYCAAQAIAVALVKRARGLGGSLARSSLVAAGQLIQLPFMYNYPGRAPFNEPSGRDVKGWHAFYRCYQAADGWLFLALNTATQLQPFADLMGLTVDYQADMDAAGNELERRFITQPVRYWQQQLAALDVGCQPLHRMSALRQQHLMSAQQADLNGPSSVAFIRHEDHPCGRAVDLIAPNAIRLQQAAVRLPKAMPKYGQDSRNILNDLGYDAQQIDRWIDAGVVAEQWSQRYLPD